MNNIAIHTLLALILVAGTCVSAQDCGCADNFCCSKWGYCGTTTDYCGSGCQSGPCYDMLEEVSTPELIDDNIDEFVDPENIELVGDPEYIELDSPATIVTPAFFNAIINKSSPKCAGRGFYTMAAFLQAARFYPKFAPGTDAAARREIAAFFAHVTHETGFMCYKEEIGGPGKKHYCDKDNKPWPCNPKKYYYGRGPLQLTWNYNYGPAGKSIGFDGLNNPDIVAQNNVISFRTAFWFWMNNVHNILASGQGFGATIRAINGGECKGGNPKAVSARVQYYKNYCSQLRVDPGKNLRC